MAEFSLAPWNQLLNDMWLNHHGTRTTCNLIKQHHKTEKLKRLDSKGHVGGAKKIMQSQNWVAELQALSYCS